VIVEGVVAAMIRHGRIIVAGLLGF